MEDGRTSNYPIYGSAYQCLIQIMDMVHHGFHIFNISFIKK